MNLQRMADALEREANKSGLRGHAETAEAIAAVRAVVLEELAEQQDRGIVARLRRLRLLPAGQLP